MRVLDHIHERIRSLRHRSLEERVAAYNEIVRMAAKELLQDLPPDPALSPQLLKSGEVFANDYNPNRVADVEMQVLELSITDDGVTMCVVVAPESYGHEVVDGFHRHVVLSQRLGREYIPCAIIDKPRGGRMASTVRHNRARGKHQVDLQGALVVAMSKLGHSDEEIARDLGMSEEEILRLKQIVGAAKLLAGVEYASTYGRTDEPPDMLGE